MNDQMGNSSCEKTTQWLEDILQAYFTYLKRNEVQNCKETEREDCNSRDKSEVVSEQPVVVRVIDFDIGPGFAGDDRISTLSDLLSLHVRFKIGTNDDEEKTEDLIVKIPPNDKTDREMAQMAQVDKREIHFYTEALVQMQAWARKKNVDIKVCAPICYFAKYHTQIPVDGDEGASSFSDAESVLVLEDLRPKGFIMKDFSSGLSLDEVLAALRELAVVHGLSWSMQESLGQSLDEIWDFVYKPRKAVSAYKVMIEHGFPTLAHFLENQQPDGPDLLRKLKELYPKASELLYELLEPPQPPAPSCLTHMDFWCNNLMFRERPSAGHDGSCNSPNGNIDGSSTDCYILDWQMMAISRPTHDVALLLFTSLTPSTRVKYTDLCLKHYWNVFQETVKKFGIELPFDYRMIESEFQKSELLALLLVIGSIDLALDMPATELRLMEALRDMAKQELI